MLACGATKNILFEWDIRAASDHRRDLSFLKSKASSAGSFDSLIPLSPIYRDR